MNKAKSIFKKTVPTLIAVALISGMVGSRLYENGSQSAGAQSLVNGRYERVSTLDEVVNANTAAIIAKNADLLVKNNVQNVADSLEARLETESTETVQTSKPAIVETDTNTVDDIVEYTVQSGDTIEKVASRFKVSADTIRWENDIVGNFISEGRELTIPPITGLIYTVAEGDTAESIAKSYEADADRIIAFNDAEVDGLANGQKILIPDGIKPAPVQQYIQLAPVASSGVSSNDAVASTAFSFGGNQPVYGQSNLYGYGYCTWHAANRRAEIGRPIPNNLGNAVTWATLSARAGLAVSEQPQAGAVLWHKNTYIAGGLGHVAFVERINPDGSALISEMNYAGWNVVSNRTLAPAEFSGYLFIY